MSDRFAPLGGELRSAGQGWSLMPLHVGGAEFALGGVDGDGFLAAYASLRWRGRRRLRFLEQRFGDHENHKGDDDEIEYAAHEAAVVDGVDHFLAIGPYGFAEDDFGAAPLATGDDETDHGHEDIGSQG